MINGAAISTDYERAVIIFKRLIAAFSEKKIPWLCQENLPEEQCLPPSIQRGSREHSCFLWFAAPLMRGKIKSDDVLKRVGMLYEKEPSLFLPEKAAAFSDVVVTAYLKSGGIKYKAEEFGASWVKNAAGLENYGWDPIKPFYDARRYRDIWTVLKIKDIFAGWREKILSLLTLWYEEVGFVGPLYGPPALDIQKLRLLFATSILRPETNAVDVEKPIKIALPFL